LIPFFQRECVEIVQIAPRDLLHQDEYRFCRIFRALWFRKRIIKSSVPVKTISIFALIADLVVNQPGRTTASGLSEFPQVVNPQVVNPQVVNFMLSLEADSDMVEW
jgi:hypothetical protein